jgi:transposase
VNSMHYVGLDVHKKTISFCVRQADGTMVKEGTIQALDRWVLQLPQPWTVGMEATMFTGWIYDHLVQYQSGAGQSEGGPFRDAPGHRCRQKEE